MNVSRVHDGERENSGEEDLRGSAALDRLRDIRSKNSGTGVVAQPKRVAVLLSFDVHTQR